MILQIIARHHKDVYVNSFLLLDLYLGIVYHDSAFHLIIVFIAPRLELIGILLFYLLFKQLPPIFSALF